MLIDNTQEIAEFERRKAKFSEYLHSKEYQEKLLLRLKINDACTHNLEARTTTWQLCARPDNPVEGCIFFIENFGYTFDPRPQAEPHNLPFILFQYQKDTIKWLIEHIDNGRDGLIEKSRDMGATWLVLVWVMIWYWLFRDGCNFLLGSYKEALVDNRGKDSIFGMIDYGIDSLPKWLLPKGFNKDKHRTQLKIQNPANSNLISGDTMNPDFGRGTRKTAILFDELGSWDYAKDGWESAGDATTCRIALSTPKGYNFFAMLRESGIDVLTLHWKLHPLKDQQWYEFEKKRRSEEEIAQELDISYNKSQEGRVYPEWNQDNVEEGFFPYDENLPLYVGWDFGFCLSEDTEALTKNGWKNYKELKIGDFIYTLNQETKFAEWQPIRGITALDFSGEAGFVNGRGFKALFMDGHKWFLEGRKGIGRFATFEEASTYEKIRVAAKLSTFPAEEKYDDSLVELVAWTWTEGYINGEGLEIGQAIQENIPLIRLALKNQFDNEGWVERRAVLRKNANLPLTRFYIYKEQAKRILVHMNEKKIVSYDFINSLTERQLKLFVDRSLRADGNRKNLTLKQVVPERTEVFAYALMLLGNKIYYSNSEGRYRNVKISSKNPFIHIYNFKSRNKRYSRKKYTGKMWCPTIDNKIWLARKDGTVYFTGNTDDTALIWAQPAGRILRIIDTYRNNGKTIDFYVPFITGIASSEGYKYTKKDLELIAEHRNWKRGTHFGDPAGRFHNQVTNQTVLEVLRNNGIVVNFKEKWKEFSNRKTAAKNMIKDGIQLNLNERTKYFAICMMNAAYPKIKHQGVDEVRSLKPKHDYTSHYRSAFEYLCQGIDDLYAVRNRTYDKFPVKNKTTNISSQRKRVVGY